MKIINLIRCEFIKNYNIKKFLLITLILTIASLFLVNISNNNFGNDDNGQFDYSISFGLKTYKKYSGMENKSFKDNYFENYYKNYYELFNSIKDMSHSDIDWKITLIFDIIDLESENYLINQLINNPNDKFILDNCIYSESYEQDLDNTPQAKIYKLCNNNSNSELKDLYIKNQNRITDYKKILKQDKYYLYLKYMVDNKLIKSDKFIELAISRKVESNTGIFGYNYMQYKKLENNSKIEIINNSSFKNGVSVGNIYFYFDDYLLYSKYMNKLKNSALEYREVLYYSSLKNIPHDISYNYFDNISEKERYMNTKLAVNQVYHFSVVVMLIISITCGGIISNEHNKGTIKNLVTAPIKRWKILLSKFLFLILNTYFIWLLGLLIISIVAGIKYGFSDLFTPKLIYSGGKVIEVNYYLYLLKNIFIASIPIICFLSILFFISTVTLNTSLTVGITTGISIVSPFLWIVSIVSSFKQIVYTPLWYFDLGFMFNNSYLYSESLRKVYFDLNYGITICLIIFIILYLISNFVYIKRDIKN